MSEDNKWKEKSGTKKAGEDSDKAAIERGYMSCPLCDAEIPISSEDVERREEVFCSFCQVDYKIKKTQDDEVYLDGDF